MPIDTALAGNGSTQSTSSFRFYRLNLSLFIAGALLPLAYAPINIVVLAYLCPLLLFYSLLDCSVRQAFWRGFIFGFGFFVVGVSWVFVAIYEFGNTPLILAIFLTLLFVSVLALVLALQAALAVKLLIPLKQKNISLNWVFLLLFPLIWVLFEWIRGFIFTGFPWLNLGYAQIDTPLVGYAAIIGVYGLSWLVLVCSGLLMLAWNRWCSQQKKQSILFVILFAIIFLFGYFLGKIEWTQAINEPLQVSLIQGNVPQITKWDAKKVAVRLQRYKTLTEQHWDSDLIIWPENSLTLFYQDLKDSYLDPLQQKALQHNTDLIIGLPYINMQTKQYYSSFMSFGRTPGIYKKTHLVPFGEYIPFQEVLRGVISFLDLPMSGFSAGEKNQTLLRAAGQTLAITICYEDVFGEEVIRQLPEATLLVNGSNNAWYGNSLAPHQHLQIARMRAAETGRELLRVTTNGISAFVDHHGGLLQTSPQFKEFVLTRKVQPRSGATPYVGWGNTPVIILFVFFLLVIILWGRNKA